MTEPSSGAAGYVRIAGGLDHSTVAQYESRAIAAAQTDGNAVTVDVTDLTSVDSAGLGLLADVLAICSARRRRVILEGASIELHKLLLDSGMESLFSYRQAVSPMTHSSGTGRRG